MKKFLLLIITFPLLVNAQNVGIGTSAPATKLHVDAGVLGIGRQDGADVTPYLQLGLNDDYFQYLTNNAQYNSTTDVWNYVNVFGYGGLASKIEQYSGFIKFSTANGGVNPINWNDRLYIGNNGNVGIGTILPGATLNVIHPTANTTPTKPTGTWSTIIENNQDSDDGRHGLSVATRWGGASSKIFEVASYWSGSGEVYTPVLTVSGNRNVGIGTTSPKSKLHVLGGISLGTLSAINETWGSRNAIQLVSTVGEVCVDHTAALLYSTMACAWGAATLNVAISTNWETYNTTNLAMKIGQDLTTFNNQIRAGNLSGGGDGVVMANNDGTLYKASPFSMLPQGSMVGLCVPNPNQSGNCGGLVKSPITGWGTGCPTGFSWQQIASRWNGANERWVFTCIKD